MPSSLERQKQEKKDQEERSYFRPDSVNNQYSKTPCVSGNKFADIVICTLI